MNKISLRVFIIFLVLVAISGCITGIEKNGRPASNDTVDGEPSPPVDVEFFFSEKPELNKEVTLTLEATSVDSVFEYVKLGINLPQGFELVGGKSEWEGVLKPREPQSISIKVKAIREGRWEPEGTVFGYYKFPEGISSGYNLHGKYPLYVYIKGDVVKVSNIPPPNNWVVDIALPVSQNDRNLTSNLIISESPNLNKEVELTYILNASVQLNNAQLSVVFPKKGMEIVNITSATIEQAGHVSKVNLELIEGTQQYNWRGFIPDHSIVLVKMIVKTTLTGEGNVHATVSTYGADNIVQTVKIFIKIDEFSASYKTEKVAKGEG